MERAIEDITIVFPKEKQREFLDYFKSEGAIIHNLELSANKNKTLTLVELRLVGRPPFLDLFRRLVCPLDKADDDSHDDASRKVANVLKDYDVRLLVSLSTTATRETKSVYDVNLSRDVLRVKSRARRSDSLFVNIADFVDKNDVD